MERLRNPAIWILVVACLFPLWAATQVDHRLLDDDALITLSYSKNLARGNGFVINHPPPVLGTTTPLFAIAVAVLSVAAPFAPLTALAVWFSTACWIGVAWAVYGFRRQYQLEDGQAAVVGLVVIATGWVGHLEMEAYLFAVLLVVTVGLFFAGRAAWAGVGSGLLFLTRGEGALLFGILLIVAVVGDLRPPQDSEVQHRRSIAARLSLGFGLPVLVWTGYALITFGSVVPNTLAAKIAQGSSGLWRPFLDQLVRVWAPSWGHELWLAGHPILNLWYALVAVGLVVVARNKRPLLVLAAWTACYVAGYSALGVAGYRWYGLPVYFVVSLLFGVGLASLAGAISRFGRRRAVMAAVSAVVVALVVGRLALPTARAAVTPGRSERKRAYLGLASWFRDNTEPRASVAYHEIGYLSFYTDNRIVDLVGLVTPDITSRIADREFGWGFWQHRPDYFVHLQGSQFQSAIVSDDRFATQYRPVAWLPGFDHRVLTVYRRLDGG